MNKNTALKIGGVVAIVGGTVAMFLTGVPVGATTDIVAAVFVLAGLIAGLFGSKK